MPGPLHGRRRSGPDPGRPCRGGDRAREVDGRGRSRPGGAVVRRRARLGRGRAARRGRRAALSRADRRQRRADVRLARAGRRRRGVRARVRRRPCAAGHRRVGGDRRAGLDRTARERRRRPALLRVRRARRGGHGARRGDRQRERSPGRRIRRASGAVATRGNGGRAHPRHSRRRGRQCLIGRCAAHAARRRRRPAARAAGGPRVRVRGDGRRRRPARSALRWRPEPDRRGASGRRNPARGLPVVDARLRRAADEQPVRRRLRRGRAYAPDQRGAADARRRRRQARPHHGRRARGRADRAAGRVGHAGRLAENVPGRVRVPARRQRVRSGAERFLRSNQESGVRRWPARTPRSSSRRTNACCGR